MEQWLRDALAEEQGYIICPITFEAYTICDQDCEHCEDYIDFKKGLEERYKEEENERI